MSKEAGTARVKRGMAEMLKGGVIMDVVNVEQAKIAEAAGAVAVMALERVLGFMPFKVCWPAVNNSLTSALNLFLSIRNLVPYEIVFSSN